MQKAVNKMLPNGKTPSLESEVDEVCPFCGSIIVERFVGVDGVPGCCRSCILEDDGQPEPKVIHPTPDHTPEERRR